MSTDTTQTILNKIQKENIKPKARWYFVVEHAVLWIPGVLVTLLGAIAIAGILYSVVHSGWEYREFVYQSQIDFIMAAIPFIWVISFLFFNSLIVKALRTTHSGYRLSVKAILLGSVTTSIVLGAGIYASDEAFKANSVIRYQVQMREQQVLSSPEKGRLVGRVEKKYDSSVTLRDKDNTLWSVDMSGFGSTTLPFVEEGESINVIGTTTDENSKNEEEEDAEGESHERVFVACAIFPREMDSPIPDKREQPIKMRNPRIRSQNKNPDCKTLLENIKEHVRKGERN